MNRDDDEETLRTERMSSDEDDDGGNRRARKYHEGSDSDAYRSDSDALRDVHELKTARERKYATLKPPIASLCSALGGVEEFRTEHGDIYSAYSLGDQVVGCLKDLKRFWRMDDKDEDRTVARIFYDVGLLNNDLIPILLTTLGTSAKGDRIALAFELMAAMTWPINVAEELQDAKSRGELQDPRNYASLMNAQRQYKASLLRTGCLRAIFQLMSPSLTKSRRDRSKKDENIISLVMFTFRNLAAIRDKPSMSDSVEAIEMSTLQAGCRPKADHSEYIRQLADEQIFDLLIAMAQNADSSEFQSWNMVTLDILHLIFRGVDPHELMVPSDQIDENKLKDLLNMEGTQRRAASRTGNSRHSRFATTLALKSGKGQFIVHKQRAVKAGVENILDGRKKGKAQKARTDDDLAPPTHLRADAVRCLQNVAVSFIDSAFNPFFKSVLKDIRLEHLKVQESDTVRFLYLSRFFMEFFLLLYDNEKARGIDPQSDEGHDFDLIAEMTEPQSIGFVVRKMHAAMEEKPVLTLDLHAGMDCFTQILLVVEAMLASGDEDNVTVAEVLQNKIYYEQETFNLVLRIIADFKAQSNKYLDSTIHLAFTLLRTLEKFSKTKAFMFVRKKQKARARRRDGDAGGGDEEDEVDRQTTSFADHAFKFERYQDEFAVENSLSTFILYLENYRNLDNEQLKRIVNLLHRLAIKAKSEVLFFKPSILELFHRIINDNAISMSREQAPKDLCKLIDHILRKLFKAVEERPFMLLEAFFPKTKGQLSKAREGDVVDFYESSSDEDGPGFRFKQAEVEVQPGFTLSQQIGIAVASLVDAGDLHLVEIVKKQLTLASASRTEIVLTTDKSDEQDDAIVDDDSDEALRQRAALLRGGPSETAKALFEPHLVNFETDENQEAGTSNSPFKLLMRLLQWECDRPIGAQFWQWVVPVTLMPATLDGDVKMINDFLIDPVNPQGKTAADLLRKKRKTPVRRARKPLVDEDGNEIVKPAKKTRQNKEKETEQTSYKSAQFIEDSDDDAEADERFFAMEAALRAKMAAGAIANQPEPKTKKQSKAQKQKTKAKGRNGDADNLNGRFKQTKKQKQARRAAIDARIQAGLGGDQVSEDSDDDDLFKTLKRGLAREKGRDQDDQTSSDERQDPVRTKQSVERGSSEQASATNSSSLNDLANTSTSRKRRVSVTSGTVEDDLGIESDSGMPVSSQRRIASARPTSSHDSSDEEPTATAAAKKRRVIVDSDDDE
ncbi:Topoisomerase 1-associated factor 1 [Microbotryomycetes sp. JL201]|nr:Topoisomerase 1-associated factor 1 [Microbotryomycetes sp. JL201]